MLAKVISGGQTGVDQAALRAARALGIPTGGWAPKGWLTEDGPAPWLANFGLLECEYAHYPVRTRLNVKAADYIVCVDTGSSLHWSSGTRLLVSLTNQCLGNGGAVSIPPREVVEMGSIHLGKPIPLPVKAPGYYGMRPDGAGFCVRQEWCHPDKVAGRIRESGAAVLMVAGNRESRHPGVGAAAEEFLMRLLEVLKP